MSKVTIIGQRKVERIVKKFANPEKIFDKDVRDTSLNGLRMLVRGSHGKGSVKTGNTARGWTTPIKIGPSRYIVSNDVKTKDKKHLIVDILSKGHRVIRPKKAKHLYIPLTNKGAAKGAGRVFGVDFVLSKKVKSAKGTKFMRIANKKSSKEFLERVQKTARRVANGG